MRQPAQNHAPPTTKKRLALRELEPLTGTLLAVLFALMLPGIAGEKASLLQRATELGVELDQSTGNTETNRTSLADDAAAIGEHQHVKPFLHLDNAQRVLHRDTGGFGGEVGLKRAAI